MKEMESDGGKISLKLFAHINNDAHLLGSRSLEGEVFKNTVRFLHDFVSHSEEKFLDSVKISLFLERLDKMLSLLESQSALRHQFLSLSEEQQKEKYLAYTAETAKKIIAGETILFPGGWAGFPAGHAMVYQFEKDDEGRLRFLVYNSGDGLQYHMSDEKSIDKNRRYSVKAYILPKEVTEEEIQSFLIELTKPRVEAPLADRKIIKRNRGYDAERLYTEVIPKIYCLGGYEIAPNDIGLGDVVTIGQRSGTCTEKSLHQLIKGEIKDPQKVKRFIFLLKKYSIEKFIEEKKGIFNQKEINQLVLALENAARILEKEVIDFSQKEITAHYLFIKENLLVLKSQLKSEVKLEKEFKISKEVEKETAKKITAEYFSDFEDLDKPVKFPDYEGHYNFFQEKKDLGIKEFLYYLYRIKNDQDPATIEKFIQNFLLRLPVNKEAYSKFTLYNRMEFIKELNDILSVYAENAYKVDPGSFLGPKRIITLLSAQVTLRALMRDACKITPFIKYEFNLKSLIKAPFLETADLVLDERVLEIVAANKLILKDLKIKGYENYIEMYTKYLEDKASKELSGILEKLFEKHRAELGEELNLIVAEGKQKEVALAFFFNEKNIKHFNPSAAVFEILEEINLIHSFRNMQNLIMHELYNNQYLHLENEKLLDPKNYMEIALDYNQKLYFRSKDCVERLNEKLAYWGKTIEDKIIKTALHSDFGKSSLDSIKALEENVRKYEGYWDRKAINSNFIYSVLDFDALDEGDLKRRLNERNIIKKEIFYLRCDSNTQILRTIDFFQKNTSLLSEASYQEYFRKNIFQPGLLIKLLEENETAYKQIDEFIKYGMVFFDRGDEKGKSFFYSFAFDFYRYTLKNTGSKSALTELLRCNDIDSLVALKTHLVFLEDDKITTDELQKILLLYIAYKENIKTAKTLSPREHQEEIEITKTILTLFKENEKEVIQYLQKIAPVNWVAKFPFFLAKDDSGEVDYIFDLQKVIFWKKGALITRIPSELAMHPLYKKFYSMEEDVSITIMENDVRKIKIINDPNEGIFFDLPGSEKLFGYQCLKTINGKREYYELQGISDNSDPENKLSASQLGIFGKFSIKNLPKSFFCASTKCWLNEKGDIFIEREGKQYYFEKNTSKVHELDLDGNKTGYILEPYEPNNKEMYDIFSGFEDRSMIEILVNSDPELCYKIYFPRYDLELHGEKINDVWIFSPKDRPDLVLDKNKIGDFPFYNAPLVFYKKGSKEKVSYFPIQEFFVKKEAKDKPQKSEDEYRTIYFDLTPSLNQETDTRLISSEEKNPLFKAPWQYVRSQIYFKIEVNEAGECIPKNNKERLYLAYLNLCQLQPRQALAQLRQIAVQGGLTGDKEEIELIEKIINGVPRFPDKAKISNPEYIAVRLHALYLISHHLEKEKSFDMTEESTRFSDSKTILFQKEKQKREKKFLEKIYDEIIKTYNDYYDTKSNVPSEFKLSEAQEIELLESIHHKEETKDALSYRRKELKLILLQKEKMQLENEKSKLSKETKVLEKGRIQKKLQKGKRLKKENDYIQEINFPVDTPFLSEIRSKDFQDDYDITKAIFKKNDNPEGSISFPKVSDSEEKFLNDFLGYLKMIILNDENDKKNIEKIKLFCEGMCQIDIKKSVISVFSGVLLKAIKDPKKFEVIFSEKPKEYYGERSVVESLLKAARKIDLMINKNNIEKRIVKTDLRFEKQGFSIPEKVAAKTFSYLGFDNKSFIREAKLEDFVLACREDKKEIEGFLENNIGKMDFKELDKKIGSMRNKCREKMKDHASKKLQHPKELAGEISMIAGRYLENSKVTLSTLEKEIIELARKGPEKEIVRFDIERLGLSRGELTINDLYRLYVLNDKHEYQKQTRLSDSDVDILHQKLCDFVYLSTLAKGYEEKKKAAENLKISPDDNALFLKLLACLTDENHADFSEDPEIQFFQKEEGYLVYPQSIKLMKELMSTGKDSEYKNKIMQLSMGGGKSKVISPLIAFKKSTGSNLVIHQVKSSLFNTNYSDLNSTSLRLFNQEAIPLQFRRDSSCQSKDLKKLYYKLYNAMAQKNYIVTTGESLQSLELKFLEILRVKPSEIEDIIEWNKQLKWLKRILLIIKRSDRIIDEIHDELLPKKQLNYTIGHAEHISENDIDIEIKLFGFFDHIDVFFLKEEIDFPEENLNLAELIEKDYILTDIQWGKVLTHLTHGIVFHPNSFLSKMLESWNVDDKKMLENYLNNVSDELLENPRLKELIASDRDIIGLLKINISEVLPSALNKKLYQDFGPSNNPRSTIEKMLPIPYKSTNTPNEKSRFGNFIENMAYAMIMTKKIKIPDEIICEVIDDFLAQASAERLENLSLKNLNDTLANLRFASLFHEAAVSLEHISTNPNDNSFFERLRSSDNFIKYCMRNLVLPSIKINPAVLSSNAQNLVSMSNTTQGMTGTPWNVDALHQDFIFDPAEGLGIDGETIAILESKNTKVIAKNISSEEFLDQIIPMLEEKQNLRAIIDAGSLFRGMENSKIAQKIAENIKKHRIEGIEYILYYDNAAEVLYALLVEDSSKKIKLDTTDEKEISTILKCKPENRFTFYDQARTTGTDLTQSANAHAIVTISEKTIEANFLQAVKRMRKIGEGQSVTIFAPGGLKENLTINDVLNFVKENQKQELLKAIMRSTLQKIKNLIREDLLKRIYDAQNYNEMHRLFIVFSQYFESKYVVDHFNDSLGVLVNVKSETYFKDLCDFFFEDWKAILDNAELTYTKKEEEDIAASLEKTKNKAIQLCGETIDIKKSPNFLKTNFSDFEEVENELENELESELELELQQLYYNENIKPNNVKYWEPRKAFSPIFFYELTPFTENSPNEFFDFSKNLYLTKLFKRTYDTQFSFFDPNVKPIEIVLMIQNSRLPQEVYAIVITPEEVGNCKKCFESYKKQGYDVWMITPSERLLSGMLPDSFSDRYYELLEQIRYINGDCRLLAEQKKLKWLRNNFEMKMKFLSEKILPLHPHESQNYKLLESRLFKFDSIVYDIIRNAEKYQISSLSGLKEYTTLKSKQKKLVDSLLEASLAMMHSMKDIENSFLLNERLYADFLSGYDESIHYLINEKRTQLIFENYNFILRKKLAQKDLRDLNYYLSLKDDFRIDDFLIAKECILLFEKEKYRLSEVAFDVLWRSISPKWGIEYKDKREDFTYALVKKLIAENEMLLIDALLSYVEGEQSCAAEIERFVMDLNAKKVHIDGNLQNIKKVYFDIIDSLIRSKNLDGLKAVSYNISFLEEAEHVYLKNKSLMLQYCELAISEQLFCREIIKELLENKSEYQYFFEKLREVDKERFEKYLSFEFQSAIFSKEYDKAKNLLELGADVNSLVFKHPFVFCLEDASFDMIDSILSHNGLNLERYGSKILNAAVSNCLKENGKYFENYKKVIQWLLDKKVEVNPKDENGIVIRVMEGMTPLMWAASQGNEEIVRILLDNGARYDIENKKIGGKTASDLAREANHNSIVSIIEEYALKNPIENSDSAVMPNEIQELQSEPESLVKLKSLLSEEGKIDFEKEGYEMLISAVRESLVKNGQYLNEYTRIIMKLLQNNVSLNKKDYDGKSMTPLMWAASQGNQEIVKIFLEYGADPHKIWKKDPDKVQTAADMADASGYPEVAKFIRNYSYADKEVIGSDQEILTFESESSSSDREALSPEAEDSSSEEESKKRSEPLIIQKLSDSALKEEIPALPDDGFREIEDIFLTKPYSTLDILFDNEITKLKWVLTEKQCEKLIELYSFKEVPPFSVAVEILKKEMKKFHLDEPDVRTSPKPHKQE